MDPIPRAARIPHYLPLHYDIKDLPDRTKEGTLAFEQWLDRRQTEMAEQFTALCENFDVTAQQYQSLKASWKGVASHGERQRPHPSALAHLGGADSAGVSMTSLHLSSAHLPIPDTPQSAFSTSLASPASPMEETKLPK